MIDKTLAHYRIVEKIGAGGMGEVYRAADSKLGRDVALKFLPEDLAQRPGALARLEHEARSVAALNHPNIVTLFSIEEADGFRFLTMELVEGDGLDRMVASKGLPLERILDLAVPLADALAAAHERGVVHRDLKPGNVMVTPDGRVKVLDFGLAKITETEAGLEKTLAATAASPVSSAGRTVGTVPYMAPEQVRGETVDARTDLFALGILLYELATGRRPFTGDTSADVSSAILRDTPVPAASVREDLPPDLERIIGRCLEKDPERRFQTAKDVRNELDLLRGSAGAGAASTSSATAATAAGPPEAPSIAVMPFANRSRDEDDEYFTDGLADELLSVLAKIPGLRVAARTSSFWFKDRNEDLAVIGGKLNVATLLEGSVRKAGDRLRVAVQLVKVSDGFHLWSETYDRTLEDIFEVQDDIAQSVVKELRSALLGEETDSKASVDAREDVAAAVKGRGGSSEAHRLYLQGRHIAQRGGGSEIARAIDYLQRAVDLDPEHALAWAWLGRTRSLESAWGCAPVEEANARAREAAARSLALESDLVDGHITTALIQQIHGWDWNAAEASARRAIELAPGNAEALSLVGLLAYDLARWDEAIDLGRQAVERDPLSAMAAGNLGRAYRAADRLEEAEDVFRNALAISPDANALHLLLSSTLVAQGRNDDALIEAENDRYAWSRFTALAIVHHAAGRAEESERALQALIGGHGRDAGYQIAVVHAFRGELDAAFEWLERSYDQRDSGLALMKPEPHFRSLHGDPRWAAFLRKMGLGD